jgi:hypothetical protein
MLSHFFVITYFLEISQYAISSPDSSAEKARQSKRTNFSKEKFLQKKDIL